MYVYQNICVIVTNPYLHIAMVFLLCLCINRCTCIRYKGETQLTFYPSRKYAHHKTTTVNGTLILTHWDRVTHICVSKLTIIGSDNGLSPGRRQSIIWTNAGILLIRTLGTNFSEILGKIHSFSFSKMHLKMSSAKWRLFGLGLNELTDSLNQHRGYGMDMILHPQKSVGCNCHDLSGALDEPSLNLGHGFWLHLTQKNGCNHLSSF